MFNVLLLAYQMHQDVVVVHHHFVELDQVDQVDQLEQKLAEKRREEDEKKEVAEQRKLEKELHR